MEARLGSLITKDDAKEILKDGLSERFTSIFKNLVNGYAGSTSDRIKAEQDFRDSIHINLTALSFATSVLEEKMKDL